MTKLKPPETPQEALELALILAATAPDDDKMLQAAKVAFDIARSMPEHEVQAVMDMLDGRFGMMDQTATQH